MPTYRLVAAPPREQAAPVLDADQQRVVDHREGPLLVLAGPGTGKTTTVVELVAQRLAEGLDPARVLVLTFSRKAAGELRERLAARAGAAAAGVRASTFHSFALRVLTDLAPREPGQPPLRLLSAPEQELQLRSLLAGRTSPAVEAARGPWPDELRPALGTVGLAAEVRAWAGRLSSLGLDPADVAGVPGAPRAWGALADLVAELEQVQGFDGSIDYGALVTSAAHTLQAHDVLAEFDLVVLDEFQDTDPAQEHLLRVLVGTTTGDVTRVRQGLSLVVVGDPDQSIYAFRGADPRILTSFRHRFTGARGEPAQVVALRSCRRSPATLVELSRRVIRPLGVVDAGHRDLTSTGPGGEVSVHVAASAAAEAQHIADVLRAEHLRRDTPWERMAVLVRSAARDLPRLAQALTMAGVPVEVSGDELPLAQDPVAAGLLQALHVVDDTGRLTPEVALELLTGPLGAADAVAVRGLLRALRRREVEQGRVPGAAPELLAVELRRALDGVEGAWAGVSAAGVSPARALVARLRAARAALGERRVEVEEALWALWDGSAWQAQLVGASSGGGRSGRAADRDLDVIVALFTAVRRFAESRHGGAGVGALVAELEAYDLPAVPDHLDTQVVPAVRLLTAHRSKGLEWDVVVVAGVQEGTWPDVRLRSSVTDLDRLDVQRGEAAVQEPPRVEDRLAEERRLFYVAVTRARRRLVLTAVQGGPDDQLPSRFLQHAELPPAPAEPALPRRAHQGLDLVSVVARLRRAAAGDDPEVAAAAAARLAHLAAAREGGVTLVPEADPTRWWAAQEPVDVDGPLVDPGREIVLSPSSLDAVAGCALRWFLRSQARAQVPASSYQTFGLLIHAVAESVHRGDIAPEMAAVAEELDRVWPSLGHETPWHGEAQRALAEQLLSRFLTWLGRDDAREVVDVEVPVRVTRDIGGAEVTVTGRIDRLERDADGGLVVVDLKTGSDESRPHEHVPLAVYQWLVRETDEPWGGPSSGAELLQLKWDPLTKSTVPGSRVREQGPLETLELDPVELIATAVGVMRGRRLEVVRGDGCERCDYRGVCPVQSDGDPVV